MTITLRAADGLALHIDDAGACRVAWGESDWFGPGRVSVHGATATLAGSDERAGDDELGHYTAAELRWADLPFALRTTVRAYAGVPVIVFRIEAPEGLALPSPTGTFDDLRVAWPHFHPLERAAGGIADDARSFANQWSEFALPLFGDASCGGYLYAPHRPPVAMPLMLIAPDRRTLLLGSLDHFHEQVIALPRDTESVADGVRCGWHGDLTGAPHGFATELALWAADAPRAALADWIDLLRHRHRTVRPSRYADVGLARLSYWTDNGAYYYYRTEPEKDYTETLAAAVADCEARDIPIGMVQVDSWFYPHEQLRPVSAEGAPLVPPSGMMRWEPREDLFPDGFVDLQRRVGGRPLAFHSRHFSAESPYAQRWDSWTDGAYSHPRDPAAFDHLLGAAASWGAITYEQDWMVETYFGNRALRAEPGRTRRWQEALDHAAAEHGLTLQWCMATPADFLTTVGLRHVTSIRTSGDYRYLFDNGLNWVWFLHVNAMARALGLNAFKDVFISDRDVSQGGEAYAEVEALLAALSAGPVGIGDRIGRADRELVMRTCREDGVLVKPDAPLAAVDGCFQRHGFLESVLLFGETYTVHPAGCWLYVVAMHACRERDPVAGRLPLADLGPVRPRGPVLAYRWRDGTFRRLEADGAWELSLDFQDWDYLVLCPVLPGDCALFGDVRRYATVGDRRVGNVDASVEMLSFDVMGVPRSVVEIRGYSAAAPRAVEAATFESVKPLLRDDQKQRLADCYSWDAATGGWLIRLRLRSEMEQLRILWA